MNKGNSPLFSTYKIARRIAIFLVGTTVVLIGLVLIFLPGPAFIVIPAGLAILGLEFAWARHWLKHVKDRTQNTLNNLRSRRNSTRQ